jgi:hypothetical protein
MSMLRAPSSMEDEPKIVNAVLDRLARKYRGRADPETGLSSHGVS